MASKQLSLVADIGGTNARFALVELGSTDLMAQQSFPCAAYPSLADAALAYLSKQLGSPDVVQSASFALACPVSSDPIQFTNSQWSFYRADLQRALGVGQLLLLNDFTAMSLGMLICPPQNQLSIVAGQPDHPSPCIVVGPGTGLGFSALIPNGESWLALATEGGHVGFVPRDSTDVRIMEILMRRHNNRVSAERLLCGQGLFNLYECLAEIKNQPVRLTSPAEVSSKGTLGQDAVAAEAVDRFFAHLGAYCGDMVLAYGARGGVYLCGGILPRMIEPLLGSQFEQQFKNKGRFSEFLSQVPVQLCLDEFPGLKGAALALTGRHAWMS